MFFEDEDMVRRIGDAESSDDDDDLGWSDIFVMACTSDDRMEIARYIVDKCVCIFGKRFLRHLLEILLQELDDLLAGQDVPLARRVISLGADFKELTFDKGATLVHEVISQPVLNLDTLNILLDHGASLTATTYDGLTPLDVNFVWFHHCSATVAILERIPLKNIDLVSFNRDPGIMKAARIGCPVCVEAFLVRGADVNSGVSFSDLPVAQYLMHVRGESTEDLEAFRKLLRCTDKTKLKYVVSLGKNCAHESRFITFIPVARVARKRWVTYFDLIWEEDLQLFDFISAGTCCFTFLRMLSAGFHKLTEPYLTELTEMLLQAGILSQFTITGFLAVARPNPRLILFLLHQGLASARKQFSVSNMEKLKWGGSLKRAGRFIETMALLGELEIADNRCLREAKHRIEERYTLDEDLQRQCSLLGSEVLSLKRLSSNAIRQCLYECHGQVGLVPLVELLDVPPVVGEIILCRDIQCKEDDGLSSSSASEDFLHDDDESTSEDAFSLTEDFEASEQSIDEDEVSMEDESLAED